MRIRIRYRTVIFAAVVVLLSATIFLTREPILQAIGNFLVVEEKISPSDLIHVIAGLEHRTDYGIHLYQQGYSRWVFFTGGWCDTHEYNHGQHSRELALQRSVKLEVIAIDDSPVTSTYSEVVRLKEFIVQSQLPIRD